MASDRDNQQSADWRRVLLKLSGAAFSEDGAFGIAPPAVDRLAGEIKDVVESGREVAVVVGGGNIWRGRMAPHMEQATADHMGMVATVINALALQDALERADCDTRVQTAIEMREVAEPFIRRRAIRHLEKGRVVIMAAGSGHPFFTTDTAAVLRAIEIHAEALFKATDVDGVYDRDPNADTDAVLLPQVTYIDAIQRQLGVMDTTALSLAMEHDLPIIVFNYTTQGNICRAIGAERIGTLVS
ncbi:MAG: UMP kinase [Armatimonadota bacterium]